MNIFDKLRKGFKDGPYKKLITNMFIVLLMGVGILIATSSFTNKKAEDDKLLIDNNKNQKPIENKSYNNVENYVTSMEEKLEKTLEKIKGVGEVDVMLTLEDSAERIPAFNTTKMQESTEEKDAQGGTRNIVKEDTTQQIVVSNNGGNDSLLVIKEVKPKVRGVIVVAEGAEDILVKEKLYSAVKTVLGISGNKVEIYSREYR
ncbi:stage III sporulation protein AG [Caldisalinibacter kiritimatiensis]|uniref:Stage III sporulation protein AG n=1 Tax=Caldisalinibacter kiritimatiensis TaxID=1304284 RepID=R1ASY6_9FIRM|nr:stage III sporulation protein AG [Caldisalinibacter kiritimatiensis]EOC99766.1 Stage III sporulation protein AG [Caldisalinibacter kiritimatiensis]